MHRGVTCRQCRGEHIVIAWLCRTKAFGALVQKKYWSRVRDEERPGSVCEGAGGVRQRPARGRSRETKYREQHADRTKTNGHQNAGIKETGFGKRIFLHKSSFVKSVAD